MIYNGFDPGILAYLAGEDRLAAARIEAGPPGKTESRILFVISCTVLLVSVILLSTSAG